MGWFLGNLQELQKCVTNKAFYHVIKNNLQLLSISIIHKTLNRVFTEFIPNVEVSGSSITILSLHRSLCEMRQYFPSVLPYSNHSLQSQGRPFCGHCLLIQLSQGQLRPGSPPSSLSKPNHSNPKWH